MIVQDKVALARLRRKCRFFLFIGWVVAWATWGGTEAGLLGVLTFFIPMIAGSYLAAYLMKQEAATKKQREEEAGRAQAAAEAAEKAQRAAAMEQADRLSRIKNARKEVIDKFGVVADYLDLLPGTTDADRAMLITQNIKNALRELVAKYPIHDLAALIRGDEAIQLQLQSLLPRLAAAGVESDGSEVIREARHRALSARPAGAARSTGSAPAREAIAAHQTAAAAPRHERV